MKISKILYSCLVCSLLSANVEKVEFIAKEIHKNDNITQAIGEVLVYSHSYLIRSNKAIYDSKNEILEFFDDVSILRNNEEAINASYVKINLKTNEIITDENFALSQDKEIWIHSTQACSTDERLQTQNAIVSSCNVDNPDWHIEYSNGYLNKKSKFLHLFNPIFYGNFPLVGNIPILYLPYFGFSTDKTRRTGLLAPKAHFSKLEGFGYEQPIYFAPFNQWDLEINPQFRTNRGFGVYSTFRFVDSAYSKGFFRAGFFKDKTSYANEQQLKNTTHKGFEFNYERDKLAKYLLEGDYSEGLYANFIYLNDIDYLNLQNNSNANAQDALIQSKFNYFVNLDEHYFGAYANYYINTAKIGTQYANKDTIQELPSLQYHSYFDTFLRKNFTYSFDIQFHNYTRKMGVKAREVQLYTPIGLNYTAFDGWANLSWTQNFYAAYVDYSRNLNTINFQKYNTDKYIRHWQEVVLSTDLAKAYKNDLFHTINFKFSYLQPGYKYSDIAKQLYAQDKQEIEENFIEEIDELYQKETINTSFTQYLFKNNNKFLRHFMNASFYVNNRQLALVNNHLNLYFGNLSLFSKITYDHQYKNLTNTQHGFSIKMQNFDARLSHIYNKTYTNISNPIISNFLQTNAGYSFNNFMRVFGSYGYDFERKNAKMWQIGLEQNRKCWNYGLAIRRDVTPANTSAGPKSQYKNTLFIYFALYPFGDFNYNLSLKTQDSAENVLSE